MTMPNCDFTSVNASLADMIGRERVEASCRARAALTGEDATKLTALACEPVDFLPANFMVRQHALLNKVGERIAEPQAGAPLRGASTRMFDSATKPGMAPLSALGLFRVGEDGRLYLISKSEHYHAPLGHGFPGYALLERARQLGIPNATHNNTRGQITRLLEEELVCAVNGLAAGDAAGLANSMCTWPPINSVMAGPAPLYGTCTILTPACRQKSSAARWEDVATLDDANNNCPGLALASAISSLVDSAATPGCTSRMFIEVVINDIGEKLLIGS